MVEHSQVLARLLKRARRRHLFQLILEQTGLAFAVAMGGVILLLLVGTQVLDWYWLVVLFAGSFAFGLWRVLRRSPSRYRLAQIIDQRLGLHDTLSTAYFFNDASKAAPEEPLRVQREQAERVARTVDPAVAFPFVFPRAYYAAAGVALVAFGMFAIRYGVTRSLDLKASLVKMAFDSFFSPQKDTASNKRDNLRKKLEDELKKMGINVSSPNENPNQLDPSSETALNASNNDVDNSEAGPDASHSKASSVPNEKESTEAGDGQDKADQASSGEQPGNEQSAANGKDGTPQNGKQPSNSKGANQSRNEGSSLMDRMRDAMANLLNKLKSGSKPGDSKQQTAQNKDGGQSQGNKGEKGSPMPGKSQANGDSQQDQQGQKSQGDAATAQARAAAEKNAANQPSPDAKSGIGKDDGDKSAREAEQLAAMGKISEILGKRAQNVTGEVMVEVASGKQQLRTQYSQRNSAHAENGGEISRDEVPLMYQQYVQEYFERIRRTTPPASGAVKPKAGDAAPSSKKSGKASE